MLARAGDEQGRNFRERRHGGGLEAAGGATVAGIASILGVKESTVATLRRRAYAKLGISNLNSLFALCVARMPSR